MDLIAFIFVGLTAGFLGGLLGIGGGIIVIPCLFFIFESKGFPHEKTMQMAIGTSLAAMVLTAGSSAISHYRKNGLNAKFVSLLFPGIMIGSILGAYAAGILHSETLKLVFSFFAAFVGLYLLLFDQTKEVEGVYIQPYYLSICLIGFTIGFISSLLGLGGGIITVPILTYLRMPVKSAISTSAITSFLIAIFGALTFVYVGWNRESLSGSMGYIYLPAFLSIGTAAVVMAPVGASLSYQLPTTVLKRIFGFLLICVSILLVS